MGDTESGAPPSDLPVSARQFTAWKRHGVRLLSVGVSGALLFGLYRSLGVAEVGATLLRADLAWLAVSVGAIVPITVLRALRFRWVAPVSSLPGVGEALRLTLVASALNVFLPAKSGDLAKSYFVASRSETSPGVALAIVVYERLCDVLSVIVWCVLGWLVGRPRTVALPLAFWVLLGGVGVVCAVLVSSETVAVVCRDGLAKVLSDDRLRRLRQLAAGWPGLLRLLGARRRSIVVFSLALWLAHLFQIWLFTIALAVRVPFTVCASLAALALMAGQLPLTVAGLGTRDVALVVLLSRYMPAESAAALGVLTSTRNLLPALAGVPLMRRYVSAVMADAQRWKRKREERR
jgi:hypothetical protein